MKLDDHLLLWNQASVKVMDIRHRSMESGEELLAYRLPANAFLYATRGSAQVRLDGVPYDAQRFHLFHGGKGVCLDIAAKQSFEYYMILYKASASLPSRKELMRQAELDDPFRMQYGFAPQYPIFLLDIAERMAKEWIAAGLIDKLHVKSLFYQFVYEVMRQLDQQGIEPIKPDPVTQAVLFMNQHYARPITLESLVEMLDCNPRQFLRWFKRRYETSPIDYLIQLRMTKAKELLLGTDCTLKEIAESVGYPDSYYFSRQFKKNEGVSPTAFKEKALKQEQRLKNPSFLSTSPIVARELQRYSVHVIDNRYQHEREGHLSMRRKTRTSLAVTLLFCFALLLSACSGGTTNPGTGASGTAGQQQNTEATAPASQTSSDKEAPRVIKHAMGETTVNGTPKRVVILTNEGTEALLAVGVKPIGAVQSWVGSPWYNHIKDEMQDVTVVGDELQPNIEMIASLKPDLIIGNKVRQEKIYEQLNQIAPTIFAADLAKRLANQFQAVHGSDQQEGRRRKSDGGLQQARCRREGEAGQQSGNKSVGRPLLRVAGADLPEADILRGAARSTRHRSPARSGQRFVYRSDDEGNDPEHGRRRHVLLRVGTSREKRCGEGCGGMEKRPAIQKLERCQSEQGDPGRRGDLELGRRLQGGELAAR